jgi:hypothetical protein
MYQIGEDSRENSVDVVEASGHSEVSEIELHDTPLSADDVPLPPWLTPFRQYTYMAAAGFGDTVPLVGSISSFLLFMEKYVLT